MANNFSYLPQLASELTNHEWAKLISDAVADLNELLREANSRDVIVRIEQKLHSVHEYPQLSITTLAENIL